MDRFGFIHEELEIKILILYVMRLLPARVRFGQLSDLVLIDEGFDYFEYAQCLSELADTGHISRDGDYYSITEKGAEHCAAVQSSLPYSVRSKAQQAAQPLIEKMKRDALVKASHKIMPDGSCMLTLSLSDGMGDILKLTLLTSGEEQAVVMEENFRADAENSYHKMIGLLLSEDDARSRE